MNSHVSTILLGVNDMERSKRFYTEGLGWKVQNDYKISVLFVPHGGSMVGFYGRDGLADMVGVRPDGSGFSGVVFNSHSCRSAPSIAPPAISSEWQGMASAGPDSG
jgi:catechol 2,3-dioxygenase-like lactoylglutathione lyase family enzyme